MLTQRISDVVEVWSKQSPDKQALVEASGSWTYSQLSSTIRVAHEWLVELGVRPGDRVMVVCENCKALAALLFAITSVDAWPVLANARLSAREIDEIYEHSGARRAIYTIAVSPQAKQHATRRSALLETHPSLGLIGVGALNENAKPEPVEMNIANRVAAMIYTSGTTGRPKGVMLTHRNLLFIAQASAKIRKLNSQDKVYGVLPISHAVGLSVVLLGSLLSGASLYLSSRFDPVAALSTLENEKLTVMLGAPAMFSLLLDYAKLKSIHKLDFPSLRIISSSSAPLQLDLKNEVEKLFGMVLHNGYGVTECSPNISQTRPESPRRDISVGEILPGVEVRLMGTSSEKVVEGEVGELVVRGPNVMKGYYRNPEDTASAIDSQGWFKTRDLARVENGNLFILGRTKELIVRFGFNVYPAEVESVLNGHPAVVRSAVIGQPVAGTQGGEEVLAFVELAAGSQVRQNEIEEYASSQLVPYKRPSQIHFVEAMPLTATGKIKKDDLVNGMRNLKHP